MLVNTNYKSILNMAYPVMIGSLANTILNITDTIYLSRIGEVELGASAIGGVFYFVFVMIGISIGIGTQILIARRTGEKNDSAVGEIFDHSFILLFLLSIILFFILEFLSLPVLRLLLRSENVIAASAEFLQYRAYGIIFIMAATVYRSFYVGIAQPKVFAVYSFLMAGINIILGYLLIFGNYGFPKMGIAGAGLASSISEILAFFFLAVYTKFKPGIKKYALFRIKKHRWSLSRNIINLSAPLVIQNLLSMGSWFIFFMFIEKLGEHELAISNIVRGAYMVSMTPIWGFSIAANSMVSNLIGQQKSGEVILLINRIIKLALGTTLIIVVLSFLLPSQILHLFTADVNLVSDSLGSFQIVNIAMPFFAFAIVCISAVSGTGAVRIALVIEIAAIIIYLVYNYIVTFIFTGSVEWVWVSEIIYWVFTGFASYLYLRGRKWTTIRI